MGSLVPGWDADVSVPKEMVDKDENAEPLGYFARLRSHRQSSDAGGAPHPEFVHSASLSPSLAKTSAPHAVTRCGSLPGGAGGAHAPPAGGLGRVSLHDHLQAQAAAAHHLQPHPPAKYHGTDWEEELKALRKPGPSLGRLSQDSHRSREDQDQRTGAWWRSLEVGHLNEQPEEGPRRAPGGGAAHGTFMPQLPRTTELDFEGMAREREQEAGSKR